MFKYFLSVCLLFSLMATAQSNEYRIYLPATIPAETAADFRNLLEAGTRASWTSAANESEVKKGIILKIADHPSFKTKESFRLQSNGSSLLTITSSSKEGLVFGLYKHLRSLGYKFYLPDELYTIIPPVTNPFGIKTDKFDKPFLQIRNFAGTGGWGTANPDPDQSVQRDWITWKLRNGFGAAYHLSGHQGENFILENKKLLAQKPEWLATPINAENPDVTTKLNYLNKEAVEFYVTWTLKNFTRKDYQAPPPGHTDFVSIEPADGGGYLNDYPQNKNRKLPSISDQVYGAANLAAQRLDKLFPNHPNIGVNIYAYSSHAEPPSFPLHPRVFVQLIPYQFQNVAYGPSFIKLWSSKTKRFGIYDYFKYADAQFDMPGGQTIEDAMNRLVSSVKSGSEGTSYETSYSKFSTAIPLWVLGRYMTDGDADWKKNLSVLTSDLYQDAAEPVSGLFQLFYDELNFTPSLMGSSVSLLDKADKIKTNATVQQRLTELKEYLQFTHLVLRSRNPENGTLKERMLPVSELAWKLWDKKTVHSYRIMQLVSYSFFTPPKDPKDKTNYPQLQTDWFPETKRDQSAWIKIPQQYEKKVLDGDFNTLKKLYTDKSTETKFSFRDVLSQLNGYTPKKSFVIGGDYLARAYFGIYTEQPAKITVRYTLTNNSSAPTGMLSATDINYSSSVAIPLDKTSGEFSFTVPAGETNAFIHTSNGTAYRVEVKTDKGLFFFDGSPISKMVFYKNFTDPFRPFSFDKKYYPSYIFFPKNVRSVDYRVQLNTLDLQTPAGTKPVYKAISTESSGFEIRRLVVDPSQSGKIWKAFADGNYHYKFLTIPDRYLLLEEQK